MKTIAFALITAFLFSGCVVRVVESKDHRYGYKNKYSHHYHDRKGHEQKPAPKKIVYRDVADTTKLVKITNNQSVQIRYRTERTVKSPAEPRRNKEINRKVHKTKKVPKVEQHAEDKGKKQDKHEKRSEKDKR